MRVIVRVGAGNPELLAELEATQPRSRAERLRFLAALGLSVLRNRPAVVVTAQESPPASVAHSSADDEARALASVLLDRLAGN